MERLPVPSRRSNGPTIDACVHDGGSVTLSVDGLMVYGKPEVERTENMMWLKMYDNGVYHADALVDNHVGRRIDVWLSHHVDDYVAE